MSTSLAQASNPTPSSDPILALNNSVRYRELLEWVSGYGDKFWFDGKTNTLHHINDHHWREVEDNPGFFANFSDDELEMLSTDDYPQGPISDRVFGNRWVRVTVNDDTASFQASDIKDARAAVQSVLEHYRQEGEDAVTNLRIDTGDHSIEIPEHAIAAFVKHGRVKPEHIVA